MARNNTDQLFVREGVPSLLVRMNSFARALLAYGGVALLVGACALDIGQRRHPPTQGESLQPSSDINQGTSATNQGSPATLPPATVSMTPQPSLSSPAAPSGPLVNVELHDRFWDPFVDLGPPIGLPYGLRSVRDATELADLVIRGSITDLYIGEQWIGAPDEPPEPLAYLTIQIQEVLKGEPASRTDGAVEMQFGFGYSPDDFDVVASEPMPTGEYLWFLIHEATQRADDGQPARDSEIFPFAYYSPNEVQGVVLNANGAAEVVLAERFEGSWGTDRFPMTIRGQSFESVVDEVRSLIESEP